MKKIIFCIFCIVSLYSFINAENFFSEKKLPLGISLNSNIGEIAFFVYRNDFDYEIIWEGSGYLISLTGFYYDDSYLYLDFFKIWIGAEEINKDDVREIYKYQIKIFKDKLIDNITKFNNITPSLILEDSTGSVMRHCNKPKEFNVKSNCYLYEKAGLNCQKVKEINSNETFSIIDVVLSEENKKDVWLKIDVDGTVGYIPLSSLADDWKVVKNDLNKYLDVAHIQAFCNDNRVRIRTEPNLNCETVGYLNKGDKVYIKSNSDKKQTIDNESWYWNQVELPDGTTGWVYGKYLDIEQ